MARLMSAVRNSNTRASHASVDMNDKENKAGAGGSAASASGANAGESFADATDRRSSFSYLRRASERRRRLRMRERQEGGVDNQDRRESCITNQEDDDNAASGGGHMDVGPRRDSEATSEPRLRRAQQTYDDDGEMASMMMDHRASEDYDDQLGDMQHETGGNYRGQARHSQQQTSESQRRQSINDRLTEAVTDVMEFVREESFKRGKRHSLHRRRQMASTSAMQSHGVSSAYPGVMQHPMEGNMDSNGVRYRRRRNVRRSPRRSTASYQQRQSYMNDSDTGSMASMTQEQQHSRIPMTNFEMQHHHQQLQQQRFRLQQHGGSVQDGQGFYDSDGVHAQIMRQHRRHQSADACDLVGEPMHRFSRHQQQHLYDSGQLSELDGHMINARGDEDRIGPSSTTGSTLIRPIQVGQSPPPMVGGSDVEMLAAARRKREDENFRTLTDNDEETAIHLGSDSGDGKQDDGQVRFIAPSVAPLNSPSALIIPDEEIVPPDVPHRGRRLPQIPGSGVIRSAADFLQTSFYNRHQPVGPSQGSSSIAGAMAAATSNIAATPLVGGAHFNQDYAPLTSIAGAGSSVRQPGEPIFPSVSESPTSKIEAPVPPGAQTSIVKRQPTMEQQLGAASSSLDGSGNINFPRVSFSPTHGMLSTTGLASTSSPSYHSAMIATQSGGTQSTVLATMGPTQTETMLPDRLAWTRGRLVKKEEKDDWF